MISKMGWFVYSQTRGIVITDGKINFDEDSKIKFYFKDNERRMLFLITQKQKVKNTYNFIVIDHSTDMKEVQNISFNTNLEILQLIIHWEAATERYQRQFRISKILK